MTGSNPKKSERTFKEAKEAAYRFLSYRDRSSKEMVAKLGEKGFSEGVIAEAISFLKGSGYLDDARFARQWARSRMVNRRFGPIRLRGELLEKGISPAEIEDVLSDLSEQWDPKALAEQALRQRFHDLSSLQDVKARRKAFAYLQRKGFGAEIILKAFKTFGSNSG